MFVYLPSLRVFPYLAILLQRFSGINGLNASGFYSFCDLDPKSQSWQKTNGYEIQSWIQSIVPANFKDDEESIRANFNCTDDYLIANHITSNSGITWMLYGRTRLDGWMYKQTKLYQKTFYIYPDYKTSIFGNFTDDGKLIEGVMTFITHYRCLNGIIELKFKRLRKYKGTIFNSFIPNRIKLSNNPMIRDPLDRKNVYVHPSISLPEIRDEDSLYARRNIAAHSLISYYNGYYLTWKDVLLHTNKTFEAMETFFKYTMCIENKIMHMPFEMSKLNKYIATLGHKVNHHFWDYNAELMISIHPVYGEILCLCALKNIQRGEELFVHYGYDLNNKMSPKWYQDMYFRYKFKYENN